eukprot:TRINITY_DN3347_c0_g1_i1.p1 TRINITY_DN3347_c0_g1~~TRINITY_DN3347_c0_g1_i1.p1  ORF type:complete len:507 (+),score=78.13 TRINITY_DN3347_c0_g1_i1:82-1521(+)
MRPDRGGGFLPERSGAYAPIKNDIGGASPPFAAVANHQMITPRPHRDPESTGPLSQRELVMGNVEDRMTKRAELAAALLYKKVVKSRTINVEENSIYGCAMVMPQFARSAGWPVRLSVLAARSYFFMFLNVVVQLFILRALSEEDVVMNKFGGQMYLCDFGAQKDCPGNDGCLGPEGTIITPPRMYSYQQWAIQKFVKASFMQLFPEKEEEIDKNIDPGEYGVENLHVRALCILLFVMGVTKDFYQVLHMLTMLWTVPTRAESWLDYDEDLEVKLKIAGMPMLWKTVNLVFLFLPKLLIWQMTIKTGTVFLMETASIDDVIVNSGALTFILNIDELFYDTVTMDQTKYMMENCEGYPLEDEGEEWLKNPSADHPAKDYVLLKKAASSHWTEVVPWRALLVMVLWFGNTWLYYNNNCVRGKDGAWVSKPVYEPAAAEISWPSAFFPSFFPVETTGDTPFWTMPETDESIALEEQRVDTWK